MRRFERDTVLAQDPVTALPPLVEMVDLLEERNGELSAHGLRVSSYAESIAREMGMPAPAIGRIRVAARLHDLGKVWISRDILDKPGPLNEAEWTEVRRHPGTAARLLKLANLHDLADVVIAHHERPDGSGYPHGVPAEETPLEARIIAVADVYDAMTSPRPYGPTLDSATARAELRRVAASQLDANVVEAFLRVLEAASLPALALEYNTA